MMFVSTLLLATLQAQATPTEDKYLWSLKPILKTGASKTYEQKVVIGGMVFEGSVGSNPLNTFDDMKASCTYTYDLARRYKSFVAAVGILDHDIEHVKSKYNDNGESSYTVRLDGRIATSGGKSLVDVPVRTGSAEKVTIDVAGVKSLSIEFHNYAAFAEPTLSARPVRPVASPTIGRLGGRRTSQIAWSEVEDAQSYQIVVLRNGRIDPDGKNGWVYFSSRPAFLVPDSDLGPGNYVWTTYAYDGKGLIAGGTSSGRFQIR